MTDIKADGFVHQAIMDQLTFQNKPIRHLSRKLKEYETLYQDLLGQQDEQAELSKEITERLSLQEAFHETIMKQLDEQKTKNQNILDQIDQLRSSLGEKVTDICEKLESIYQLISNNVIGNIIKVFLCLDSKDNPFVSEPVEQLHVQPVPPACTGLNQ